MAETPEQHKTSSPPSSIASSQISPTTIHPSSYLRVPEASFTRISRSDTASSSRALSITNQPISPATLFPLSTEPEDLFLPAPSFVLLSQPESQDPPNLFDPETFEAPSQEDIEAVLQLIDKLGQPLMSVYSTSSADSEFSNPPARAYSFSMSSNPKNISEAEIQRLIHALDTHQINTLIELRRIERIFAVIGTSQVATPMTNAWAYYVNHHGLLSELRSLTKNYPFSSDCLDEAKRRVYSDPSSNRSWNTCWLVLTKIQTDQLIPYYAQWEASQPHQWGNVTPTEDQKAKLRDAFIAEWNYSVSMLLRHWEAPPCR